MKLKPKWTTKMLPATMLCGFVPYSIMLGYGVNVFLSGIIAFGLMILTATIITKIAFGYWNPF